MKYAMDVQGFKIHGNHFVWKEVAIVPLEEDAIPSVLLFKPPYLWDDISVKDQGQNRWLEQNFHGLLWKSGSIPYIELGKIVRSILDDADIVYVKGLEKSKWIGRMIPNSTKLFNVEDMGCPSFTKLTAEGHILCNHHKPELARTCALENAQKIVTWMLKKKDDDID